MVIFPSMCVTVSPALSGPSASLSLRSDRRKCADLGRGPEPADPAVLQGVWGQEPPKAG